MSESLVLGGMAVAAISGFVGLLFPRHSTTGQWVTTLLVLLGTGLGLAGIGIYWGTGTSQGLVLPWTLAGQEFAVGIDGISAIFLLPVFLVALLGSVYGLEYWKQTDHADNGRKLRLFYGLLAAGMGLVVVSRNAILFLVGWEVMALSAFFLITTEDQDAQVRETGWIYLVATHVATLALFALFALLRKASGSFALAPLSADSLAPGTATAIFLLALLGFGLKAGIMPLHVWLPSSHAIAPSHVSAIMSGVIIKMGIYGLVRITSLLPNPALEWGGIMLGLGVISGVLGVAFAIGQHDLKRLLAYHSIENIGIIVMGLGLALVGRSLGRGDWVVLGLSGALLHVWNHALFKALLFLSAGSVIHATHTREMDQLGGLARTMPFTALAFLAGAVAICGLPPLNGFVSEFLIYLGLFRTLGLGQGPTYVGAAFAVPALALIGALALACFVKVYGAVFLGTGRSAHAAQARESGVAILSPMAILAGCCFFIGLAPTLVAPVLSEGISAWAPEFQGQFPDLAAVAPLEWISGMGALLLGALFLTGLFLWARLRQTGMASGETWGCGYLVPSPRMQYTASSFAQMLVGLFGWALRPKSHGPGETTLFPKEAAFHSDVPDPMLDEAVLPTFRFGAKLFSWFRVFQQGNIQVYLLYIFLALFALLLMR